MAPNRHARMHWDARGIRSTINMVLFELSLDQFNMFLVLHASFRQPSTLAPRGTSQDFNVDDGGVVHNMAPNCHARTHCDASSAGSTIDMVLLELFLKEFNMFVRWQLDLRASFRQPLTLGPGGTQDKHFNVTLSEWNIGLLDGLN
ncbi:hypothetical protein DFH27DRAFT_614568 [Peziza echinospora]|nr:hypothetical protein DFH27DRAFT_614568 [Peziza echinospora]